MTHFYDKRNCGSTDGPLRRRETVRVREEDMETSFRSAEQGKGEIDLAVFVPPQQREEPQSANCSETEHINLLMTQQHTQIENTLHVRGHFRALFIEGRHAEGK